MEGKTHPVSEVADAWERWCGVTPWSATLRKLEGWQVRWYCGYPKSASAIPLCFVLIRPDGSEFEGHSRLMDIRNALAEHSRKEAA